MVVLRGQSTLAEQKPRREWSRTEGWQTVRSWVGTNDAIEGLVAQLQAATGGADRIAIFPDGPVSRLEAYVSSENAGAQETAATTWELVGNDLTKSLYELKKSRDLGTTVLEGIQEKVKDKDYSYTVPAGDATSLYELIRKGTDSFTLSQYVLKKTSVVGSNYTAQIAFSGINKRWTTTQINAAEAIPTSVIFSITTLETSLPAAGTGFAWSWLKRTPTVRAIARNRLEVSQEWYLEAWSTWIYEAHS